MFPVSMQDSVSLPSDVEMPLLGFGTFKSAPGKETERAVLAALEVGYRSIDTASLYGNEQDVGAAIRASGVPRESIFVATKVWNDDQGYERTLAAFDLSLERLGLDYVDLYLVHWAIPALMAETWRAMQALLGSGRTRAIGVCNHTVHHLEALLALAETPPAVNQVEFHPRLQQPALERYCREQAIALEAWAPIMRGRVAEIPELVEIGARYGKTPAQVSLRWMLQLGVIAIPKSVHEARIRENADVFDFDLSEGEMAAIAALDTGERLGPDPTRFD